MEIMDETGMQNPIFRLLIYSQNPKMTNGKENPMIMGFDPIFNKSDKPSEFYDIIKHVFPFEKIEIIHENPYFLNYSYNIVNDNQTKRIDFTFINRNVYDFIIEVYKYSKNENEKKKKFYELISLTLKLNIDISTQINQMKKKNNNNMNMMNNNVNQMGMDQMGMNQINWCNIIQIPEGTGKNKFLNKLISLCEIYVQNFPTQNFQLSYNIFSIFLNKKNKILYIINMLNGITTISELETNIFLDLLNPKNYDNNNNILDEEYLLDLAKKNSPEYFIFSVNNYIIEIEHGYQIFDSEYSKKKNKLYDLLNQFQSKYFNQLKQKEFNSNMEILIKLIKVANNNESLRNSLLECKKNIKLNDNNMGMGMRLNKFLIENKDEINIYKEKLKSNVDINKIVDLIYKMQSLYIYEINSKNLLDIRYEIIQLLIQLYFQINSIFYYSDTEKKIELTKKRFRILNNNIINFYELIENIKNCPKKIKDILNKVILYIEREKFTENYDFNKDGFHLHKTNNNEYYNLIEQLIVFSQMQDNETIINNFYDAIIFIYELNEKKNKKSNDDKENYNSIEKIENIINLVRIFNRIHFFSSIDSNNDEEKIYLSCFFDFSNEIFDIMNILGYKATESELQFKLFNISIFGDLLNLAQINTPEYLQSSIDNYINKIENVKLNNFTNSELKQNKKDIYKLLKKIKSLISNEQKKIFEKDMEKLKELYIQKYFSLNLFNSKDKPENITKVKEIEDNLKIIAQLIYKMINLYEDEINSKELEICNVKLIQSLIQMDEKFIKVYKKFQFLQPFIQNNLKEKKNGNKIIINFYDLVQKEIYLDLKLMVNEIVLYIFRSIFNENIRIKEQYYRKQKEQTTKDIIVGYKEIEEILNDKFIYSNLFYLEYKNKNILKSFNKTGKEIGLKDDEVIYLKTNKNIFDLNQNYQFITIIKGNDLGLNFKHPSLKYVEKELINEILKKILSFSFIIFSFYKFNDTDFTICQIEKCKNIVGCGAGPIIDFVNVEKGIVKDLKFSKDAPKWRKVKEGLNIFGICKDNKECEAFKKEVIYTTNMTENGLNFNLNEEILNIKCPICKKIIRPKTCGFWQCEYQFQGRKIEDGELKSFDTKPKETCEDKFEYFDPFGNGEVQWIDLNIYVLPKQKIKYEENI